MSKKCPKTLSGKHHWITKKPVDETAFDWRPILILRLLYPKCLFCGIIDDITVGQKTRKNKKT